MDRFELTSEIADLFDHLDEGPEDTEFEAALFIVATEDGRIICHATDPRLYVNLGLLAAGKEVLNENVKEDE